MISRGAVIHVKVGLIVDPYLEIAMPRLMKGWWKKWIYLRNDAFATLPVFLVVTMFPYFPGEMEWLGRTSASCFPGVRTFTSCGKIG
jgi:hypothetical protein